MPHVLNSTTAPAGPASPHDQATRLLRLHTPLGADLLLAEDLNAWEGVLPQRGPSVKALAGRLGDLGCTTWGRGASGFVQQPARAGLRLVVHALCQDAAAQDALLGQPVRVDLLCHDRGVLPGTAALRPWHGHVTVVSTLGADGGWFRLRLVIEPWLAWLAQGRDARLRQEMTVPQLIDDVFTGRCGQALPNGARLAPAWRWQLRDPAAYPVRSSCAQRDESDLDVVLRLMHEEGLCAWWEHAAEGGGSGPATHTLVIADHVDAVPANPQPELRFTASDHTLGEDSLTTLCSLRRVGTQRVGLTSRDDRSGGACALAHRPVSARLADPLALFDHSVIDHPGLHAYPTLAHGERLARLQQEALQAAATRSVARGPWRRAQAGTWFTLHGHPLHAGHGAAGPGTGDAGAATGAEAGEFVILAVQHRARNNLSADERARGWGLAQTPGAGMTDPVTEATLHGEPGRHPDAAQRLHEAVLWMQPRAQPLRLAGDGDGDGDGEDEEDTGLDLFASRLGDRLRPPDPRRGARPVGPPLATAVVVGDGAPVHTDRDGRIRIQAHWQRGRAASHRLAHPGGHDDAPASAASHPWVRVAPLLAGANYGAAFIPRVGQEAALLYLGGAADRPVVIGSLYNGEGQPDAQGNRVPAGAAGAAGCAPAWFAGTGSGHAHDAVLSGWRSQALGHSSVGQGGSSQLVFDDTPAQRRLELGVYRSPERPEARLQLGHLLQQDGNRRLHDRGHGLDLSTARHGALRAGSGLLLSAHGRPPSTGSGQQMDSHEPQDLLRHAQQLQQALADSARAHQAGGPGPHDTAGHTGQAGAPLPVQRGLRALQDSLAGTMTRAGASSAPAPESDATQAQGGWGTVTAWHRPELVLAAPAGVGLLTPAHALLAAGAHLSATAGEDLQFITQSASAVSAARGIVLFTLGRATQADKPATETGIALHAATGSVQVSVPAGHARLAASRAVELASSAADLDAHAARRLRLAAGGAGIEIRDGAITLSAPGAIEVHAGMKRWEGGQSLHTPAVDPPTARVKGCSLAPGAQA